MLPYAPPRRRNLPRLTAAADRARLRPTQATWAESKTGHTLPDGHGPHSTSWTQEAHRKSMRRRAAGTPTTDRWAAGGFTPAPPRAYRTSVRIRVCLHRVAPRMTRNLTSSAFAHVIQRPGEHRRSRGGVASPCRHTGSAHVSMRLVQRAPEHPSEADHRSPLFGRSSGSYPQRTQKGMPPCTPDHGSGCPDHEDRESSPPPSPQQLRWPFWPLSRYSPARSSRTSSR